MNNLYQKLNLKNKISVIIISIVTAFAVVGFVINLYNEHNFIEKNLLEEKVLTARIVGSYTAPDLVFDNKVSAVESLSYLKSDDSIVNAHLFDEKGQHFVSLYKGRKLPNLDVKTKSIRLLTGTELFVSDEIKVDGIIYGYILLQASTKSYAESLESSYEKLILIFLGLMISVVVIARPMAEVITKPVMELVDAAKKVSEGNDYITTINSASEDEIGSLVNAFNEMLLRIQVREAERDEANIGLKENEEVLRIMLHSMVVGVVTVDEGGFIKSFNHAAEKMFGYEEKDVINESGLMLFPFEQKIRLQDEVDYYKETGKLGVLGNGIELKGLTKKGVEFSIYLSVAEMIDPKTEKANFIISCEDITNKKLQDEQIRRTQRMDALGNLTGGVAHDYNNMLGVILGYTEILLMNPKLSENLKSYVEEIAHAGERARNLTSKLLNFSKQTSVESKAVNINDLLKANEEMIKRTLTVKVSLHYKLQNDLWNVWLESSDLEDAVVNIAINAMHAMENEGNLTFSTKNIILSEIEAKAVQLESGEFVLLRVTDTGKGMDEATRVRIFEPFFSTKKDKGTGLGLSQVYGFVKRTKGEVKVYSEVGKGTHFDFYFPRYHSTVTKLENDERKNEDKQCSGTEKILVVDDEPGLRSLAEELLGLYGYKVISAESGEEALLLLEKNEVQLMLSDIIMDGMDGFELAAEVRKKYPHIKIQLASGFGDNWNEAENVEDLKLSLLQKPYRKTELLERVRSLLDSE